MISRAPVARSAALAVLALAAFAGGAYAQPQMSNFDPDAELRRVAAMPGNSRRVQRYYYLGELTTNSGRRDVAREAYQRATTTWRDLRGNDRQVSATYAANAALGLAALSHQEFREAPFRWESWPADSARRWGLLRQARDDYQRAVEIGYPRATFEALFLRARILEEWDVGAVDTLAEREPGLPPIARAIHHLELAGQLRDQAAREYARILTLADSLKLTNATGDRDVSEWTAAARERIAEVEQPRRQITSRAEALQAIHVERKCADWTERSLPLLWERGRQIAARDAGVADPFIDYVAVSRLADGAFRPFLYGSTGFCAFQRRSTDLARPARSERWINRRLQWARQQEWLDTDISRRVATFGIEQLVRSPAMLDTLVDQLIAANDSLPADVRAALAGTVSPPRMTIPPAPELDERYRASNSYTERMEVEEQAARYRLELAAIEAQVAAYGERVAGYVDLADQLTSGQPPPEVARVLKLRRALLAARMLLLDSLATRVTGQARRAYESSRDAAVWLPPGPQSNAAQQAIADYSAATAARYRAIVASARDEATRCRRQANRLGIASSDAVELAGALEEFARHIERESATYQSVAPGL